MIEITNRAAAEIKSILEEDPGYTLRIYIMGDSQGEPQYGLILSANPDDDDVIIENNGVKLVISRWVLDIIKEGSIDFVSDENGKNFIIQSSSGESECAECDICEDCD